MDNNSALTCRLIFKEGSAPKLSEPFGVNSNIFFLARLGWTCLGLIVPKNNQLLLDNGADWAVAKVQIIYGSPNKLQLFDICGGGGKKDDWSVSSHGDDFSIFLFRFNGRYNMSGSWGSKELTEISVPYPA